MGRGQKRERGEEELRLKKEEVIGLNKINTDNHRVQIEGWPNNSVTVSIQQY